MNAQYHFKKPIFLKYPDDESVITSENGHKNARNSLSEQPYTESGVAPCPDMIVDSCCGFCPCECRIKVHMKSGRVVNIFGDPDDEIQGRVINFTDPPDQQIKEGGLCPKSQLMPQLTYNKYRITEPWKRVSEKSKGDLKDNDASSNIGLKPEFDKTSWDDALLEIAKKLKEFRDDKERGGANTIAVKMPSRSEREVGLMASQFMDLIGSKNRMGTGPICNDSGAQALGMSCGVGAYTNGWGTYYKKIGEKYVAQGKDIESSNYFFILGANLAEQRPVIFGNLLRAVKGYGGQKGTDAKMVVVDPRLTQTASKADEWLCIKPGTDMALVYGMIYHIINTDKIDKEFIGDESEKAWVKGYGKLVKHVIEKKYTPEWASDITGIDKDKIIRLADEYSTAKAACIIANAGISHHINAVDTYRVLIFLATITGNIGVPGGGLCFGNNAKVGTSLPKIKSEKKEQVWDMGANKPYAFPYPDYYAKSVVDGPEKYDLKNPYDYKLRAIFYSGNMLTQNANTSEVLEALEQLELFVKPTFLPEEDSRYADYILPITTHLEMDGVGVRRDDRAARWKERAIENPIGPTTNGPRHEKNLWIDLGLKMAEIEDKVNKNYWTGNLREEWKNSEKLWDDIIPANTKLSAGLTLKRMRDAIGQKNGNKNVPKPLRWPCPTEEHPGTSVMFLDDPIWKEIGVIKNRKYKDYRFWNKANKVIIYDCELQEKNAAIRFKTPYPSFTRIEKTLTFFPLYTIVRKFLILFLKRKNRFTKKVTILDPDEIVKNDENDKKHEKKNEYDKLIGGRQLVAKYPYQLITGRPSAVHFHSYTHWIWHAAQMDAHQTAQIHPKVAERYNLSSGDRVKISTPRGSIETPVLVWDGIQEQCIFVPQGFGDGQEVHKQVNKPVYQSVNYLTDNKYFDPTIGQLPYKSQVCRIDKI